MSDHDGFDEIVDEQLAAVTFIHDYVQLQFGAPPTLTAYTPLTVRCGDQSARAGMHGFADLLVAQLGKRVTRVEIRSGEALNVVFSDGSSIEISLRDEDYVGPEAINFITRVGTMIVV